MTVNVETDRPLSAQQILSLIEDVMMKKAYIHPSAENADLENNDDSLKISTINYIWKIREEYHRNLLKKYYSI